MYSTAYRAASNRPWTFNSAARSVGRWLRLGLPAALSLYSVTVPAQAEVASLFELRSSGLVRQTMELSCAAASLSTVLRYQHGRAVTEESVALGLIDRPEYLADPDVVTSRRGFSLLDMKRFVDRLGFRGVGLGRLDVGALQRRAPVIVPVDLHGYPHFVVFRSASENEVVLSDPAWGTVRVARDRFEDAWLVYDNIGRTGFVVEARRESDDQD